MAEDLTDRNLTTTSSSSNGASSSGVGFTDLPQQFESTQLVVSAAGVPGGAGTPMQWCPLGIYTGCSADAWKYKQPQLFCSSTLGTVGVGQTSKLSVTSLARAASRTGLQFTFGLYYVSGCAGTPALSTARLEMGGVRDWTNLGGQGDWDYDGLNNSIHYLFTAPVRFNSSYLTADLPADAGSLAVRRPNASNASWSFLAGKLNVTLPVNGSYGIEYAVPALNVSVAFAEGWPHNAYYLGENATALLTIDKQGSPLAGLRVAFGGVSCITNSTGSCSIVAPADVLGTKALEFESVQSDIGSRGWANDTLWIETEPAPVFGAEALDGLWLDTPISVTSATWRNYEKASERAVDFAPFASQLCGGAGCDNLTTATGKVPFVLRCTANSTCDLQLRHKVVADSYSDPAVDADSIDVGAQLAGKVNVSLTSSLNRSLNLSFTPQLPAGWTGNSSMNVSVGPLGNASVAADVRAPGPALLAQQLTSANGARTYTATISVPENIHTPQMAVRLRVPKSVLQGWSQLQRVTSLVVDGSSIDLSWAEEGSNIVLTVGKHHGNSSIHQGNHSLILNYETTAPTPTPTPTPRPSLTPAATPTATPTPTPEITPELEATEPPLLGDTPTPSPTPQVVPATLIPKLSWSPPQPRRGDRVAVTVKDAGDEQYLRVITPSGKKYLLKLVNEKVEFRVGEVGTWQLQIGGASESFAVLESNGAVNESAEPLEILLPSGGTGMATAGGLSPWLMLIPIMIGGAAYLAYSLDRRTTIKKRFEMGRVGLEVRPGEDLDGLELADLAPEDGVLGAMSEPAERRDTVFGPALRWTKPALPKRTRWTLWYDLATKSDGLPDAEFRATTKAGKQVRIKSNRVTKDGL